MKEARTTSSRGILLNNTRAHSPASRGRWGSMVANSPCPTRKRGFCHSQRWAGNGYWGTVSALSREEGQNSAL